MWRIRSPSGKSGFGTFSLSTGALTATVSRTIRYALIYRIYETPSSLFYLFRTHLGAHLPRQTRNANAYVHDSHGGFHGFISLDNPLASRLRSKRPVHIREHGPRFLPERRIRVAIGFADGSDGTGLRPEPSGYEWTVDVPGG